jgi:hypothetical protein
MRRSLRDIDQNVTQETLEPRTSSDPFTHEDSSPELRCWHARKKLNHLINRSEQNND